MTLATKRVKADGGASDDSMTFQRVSGGPGFPGKWKTKKMPSSSPQMITLTPKGSGGLAIGPGTEGAICDARFDGKEYPTTGPVWPAGWTCVVARHGTNAFDVTWKKDGKAMYNSRLTATGKVLTETGSAAGTSEKYRVVYDRQ